MDTSYILAGSLIDGTGGPVQKQVLLTITDGRIAAIEKYGPDRRPASSNFTNLSHCTLLPPLVDGHVHLSMSGTIDKKTREHQLAAGYDALRPVIARHLHDLFNHGVLAARDAGDRGDFALRYRKSGGMHQGIVLRAAGRAWHGPGRYGSLIGRTIGDTESLDQAFGRDAGSGETVKLVNSGLNSLLTYGRETKPQFTLKEIAALVQAAAKLGRTVMVHANGREPVRLAVEAGCRSIEHGFFMGRDNLALMADKGTFWVPTAFTMKAYATNLDYVQSQADPQVIEKTLNHQLGQLAMARELGVRVALGTDAGSLGVLHGESVVEEMKLFMQAGYSLEETIRCATGNGARLLGLENFGGLVKGREATFLVARGTPAQLPRKLSYLEGIYIGGKPSVLYRKNPVKSVVQRG
jgi:imidazolonepropionase-like amidohydrolase